MLKCDELLGIKVLSSYYEFLFALALAAECGRRGEVLDMSDISVRDKSLLSDDDLTYMRYLRDSGFIYDGSDDVLPNNVSYDYGEVKYFFSTKAVDDLYSVLFKEKEDCYYWGTDYAYSVYGKYANHLLNKKAVGNTVVHLMAHMFICFKLGERVEKPVRFFFKNLEVATPNMYRCLYACGEFLSCLKDVLIIDLDEDYTEKVCDLDLDILVDTSKHAGKLRRWSFLTKKTAFDSCGLKKGSIAVLYEREGGNIKNAARPITSGSIIRIDDVIVNDGITWKVTKYAVGSTIEEKEDIYYNLDDEYKSMFSDLLSAGINSSSTSIRSDNTGVGIYFCDEDFLIEPIDSGVFVDKKISIDGKVAVVRMSEIDAIYWILNQYNVDFDRDNYRDRYNEGKPLMWDMYDGTPVRREISSQEEGSYGYYED